ncbi:hypothetical protein B0T22DRAFT_163060 [Podospora appendiculata]|uniref:DUF7770 domain-containing protein n=1 Tax=Podospora appendiculata TaxID=314037 RepID=A0AAE0XAH4_9PEZI|nr:hypothetical protein B0T22DRAFT_163060 [Podospora appendiculata]
MSSHEHLGPLPAGSSVHHIVWLPPNRSNFEATARPWVCTQVHVVARPISVEFGHNVWEFFLEVDVGSRGTRISYLQIGFGHYGDDPPGPGTGRGRGSHFLALRIMERTRDDMNQMAEAVRSIPFDGPRRVTVGEVIDALVTHGNRQRYILPSWWDGEVRGNRAWIADQLDLFWKLDFINDPMPIRSVQLAMQWKWSGRQPVTHRQPEIGSMDSTMIV